MTVTSDPILILLFSRRESTNIATASLGKRFRSLVRAPARARSLIGESKDEAVRCQISRRLAAGMCFNRTITRDDALASRSNLIQIVRGVKAQF